MIRRLRLAKDAFRWIDIHADDAKNGGYFEWLTREGKPVEANPKSFQSEKRAGWRVLHWLKVFSPLRYSVESISQFDNARIE